MIVILIILSAIKILFQTDVTVSVPDRKAVLEDGGTVQICATMLSAAIIDRFFSVSLNTGNGTGKRASTIYCILYYIFSGLASLDYVPSFTVEVFEAGFESGSKICLNFIIIEDNRPEGNHTFIVSLGTVDPSVLIGVSATTVTIIDNDG